MPSPLTPALANRFARVSKPFALSAFLLILTACAADADSSRSREGRSSEHPSRPSSALIESRRRLFEPFPPPADASVRTPRGTPGPDYWQNSAAYQINARLNESDKSIKADCTITYSNRSPHSLEFLFLHLEQNLYRLDSSGTAMTRPGDRFGNLAFAGGLDLHKIAFQNQPPAANSPVIDVNGTIARLDLPHALQPGHSVTFTINYSFSIPPLGSDRMGIMDTPDGPVFQIAQWIPQVCKFDDIAGWNTLQYLGDGEFYTDISSFDVRITVPADHLVAATGLLHNEHDVLSSLELERLSQARTSPDPVIIRAVDEIPPLPDPLPQGAHLIEKTWHFHADAARTFAFASSRAFAWDACAVSREELGDTAQLAAALSTLNLSPTPEVLCQSFYPRQSARLWGPAPDQGSNVGGGSTRMIVEAMKHYSQRWFPYPFPAFTNVAGRVYGMEYPMLAFCSENEDETELFDVASHELSHAYLPMMVNTDERRHGWMDEGFTTFLNYFATDSRYQPAPNYVADFAQEFVEPFPQPVVTPADEHFPGLLGELHYARPGVGLLMLRNAVVGAERFDRAFAAFFRAWAFKSPQPDDFYRFIQNHTGADLAWFFKGWFHNTGVLDQAVRTVMQPSNSDGDAQESQNVRVTFENLGEFFAPVEFLVTYSDGESELRRLPVEIWATGDRWQSTWNSAGRSIKHLIIDPEDLLPDINRENNQWSR